MCCSEKIILTSYINLVFFKKGETDLFDITTYTFKIIIEKPKKCENFAVFGNISDSDSEAPKNIGNYNKTDQWIFGHVKLYYILFRL